MIDLNLSKAPTWLDLVAGVRVQLRPLSTSLMLAARADAESKTSPRPSVMMRAR